MDYEMWDRRLADAESRVHIATMDIRWAVQDVLTPVDPALLERLRTATERFIKLAEQAEEARKKAEAEYQKEHE